MKSPDFIAGAQFVLNWQKEIVGSVQTDPQCTKELSDALVALVSGAEMALEIENDQH